MSLLEVLQVNRFFGGLHAISDVSFSVESHEIKAIIGPNGAGKTTLFNLISGSIPPSSGQIIFKKNPIHDLPQHKIAGLGLSRTFQNIKLFPGMSVLENVMVGCHTKSSAGFMAGLLCWPSTRQEEKKIREKAISLLELLNIVDFMNVDAGSLAFGQQRAVEFARALAAEPELLLLDEPAAGLNIHETTELAELITKIRDTGITILLVEHDMSLVMDISDKIVVLSFGKKIAVGTPLEIQCNKEVIQIYLGESDA